MKGATASADTRKRELEETRLHSVGAGPKVGVLALQGDFEPHLKAFESLGVAAQEVRCADELEGVTHLVLPGGESTTLERLLTRFELREAILQRHAAGELALFGTCAGAILLGREEGQAPRRLGLIDAQVRRNAYGPQSLSHSVELDLQAFGRRFTCIFIRAPRFGELGGGVRVLARRGGEPVLIEGSRVLAASFHPELADDPFLHRYFLDAFPAPAATVRPSGRPAVTGRNTSPRN